MHAGALERLAGHLAADRTTAAVVVSDDRVAPLYGAPLVEALRGLGGVAHLLVFPAGERSKSRETKADLEDRLADLGVGRQVRIVAVGGGVTGDLAGFVAATWHRGVSWIQAPTSLLAMVDAAIGGKTAVDVPAAKNLIGAFHQPESVWIDPRALATLPGASVRHGLAEVVKTAVVGDARLFRALERSPGPLAGGSPEALEPVIVACARRKGTIVAADERDAGARAALNFGHTVAHALEAASGWELAHGDAVAIGLAVESALAVERTGFPIDDRERVLAALRYLGLPLSVPGSVDLDRALAFAARDKKNVGRAVRCALPCAIGRMPAGDAVTTTIATGELGRALRAAVG